MRFFFPDSQDFVDDSFDFETETRSNMRVRQRDDRYPHEIFADPPYNGLLVSKAVVDGLGGGTGKYSVAQRHRFLRVGVREYFRLEASTLETMGDCGAFTYVREERPPYAPAEVADFYSDCGFDYGLSVDHIVLGYNPRFDDSLDFLDVVPTQWRVRQELTLELAETFLQYCSTSEKNFIPIGVAQGWSPRSYAHAVEVLQQLGYRYIAFGGFVPLKTRDILACLRTANAVRHPDTVFHLLGVTRCEHVQEFGNYGVVSFDSTSPLRKAFKDDRHNYYTDSGARSAIRVPQVEANPKLLRKITAGEVQQDAARHLEMACLEALTRFDQGDATLEDTVAVLRKYELVFDPTSDRSQVYRQVLTEKPWKSCPCEICRRLGIQVIIFRGAERNRRRGFHNLFVFNRQLQNHLDRGAKCERVSKGQNNDNS